MVFPLVYNKLFISDSSYLLSSFEQFYLASWLLLVSPKQLIDFQEIFENKFDYANLFGNAVLKVIDSLKTKTFDLTISQHWDLLCSRFGRKSVSEKNRGF